MIVGALLEDIVELKSARRSAGASDMAVSPNIQRVREEKTKARVSWNRQKRRPPLDLGD